ncbi:MAG: HU family DNA-binding protein [Bacteroidota bacterium]
MRKAAIIAQVAQKTGISQADVRLVLEVFLQAIVEANKLGDKVHLRGFGSFEPRKKSAKLARNIAQNTAILIPEHYVPGFVPSKAFVDQIKDAL